MRIPNHLICLLRNLYAGQEAAVRTGHEMTDWFKIGKQNIKVVYCHLDYLTYMQSTSCKMLGWMKYKLESRLPGEISVFKYSIFKHQRQIRKWHCPYGRKLRGTKEPLDEVERGEWKTWLKAQHSKNEDHGIWSHHFMVNRFGNNGNSDRVYFLGLQNHCRWWLQPWN